MHTVRRTLISFLLALSLTSCNNLDEWKAAVEKRDIIISDLSQQVSALQTQLSTCQTTPTPKPVPTLEFTETTDVTWEPLPSVLEDDTQATAETVDVIRRIVAATTNGVTKDRYAVLMEDLELAIQSRPIVTHDELREAINESIGCLRQASKLWNACLTDHYETCGSVTRWVIKEYPSYPYVNDIRTNGNAKSMMSQTLGFLWAVVEFHLEQIESILRG